MPFSGQKRGRRESASSALCARFAGRRKLAEIVQREAIHPLVPFSRVVALPCFELLKETDHPGPAEAFLKGLQALTVNLILRRSHLLRRRTSPRDFSPSRGPAWRGAVPSGKSGRRS